MVKCKICGKYFRLLAKNRYEVYEVIETPIGLNCFIQGVEYYNAFDCPHCGCQNVYGSKIKEKKKNESERVNDKVSRDKLDAIYQEIAECRSTTGKNGMIFDPALEPEIQTILLERGYNVSNYRNGNTAETHIQW